MSEKPWTLYHLGLFEVTADYTTAHCPAVRSELDTLLIPVLTTTVLEYLDHALVIVRDQRGAAQTYKGITVDLRNRLRQHNRITEGGARNCKMRGGNQVLDGTRVWKVFYFIPNLPERYAKQLEISTKTKYAANRRMHCPQNIRESIQRQRLLSSIAATYESLNMPQCVPQATPAVEMKLEINWCLPQYRPQTNLIAPHLPVTEIVLTREQKYAIFQVKGATSEFPGGRARPWKLPPWD